MQSSDAKRTPIADGMTIGILRSVHHIALNVKDMAASCEFYGTILGLHQLQGSEVPATLTSLVAAGKVANFKTPDGMILDLFSEPELLPPHQDPKQQFTRANHFAFDIDPEAFDRAVDCLKENKVAIDHGPVSRPTGRGIYFYDPDGFMLEIRCDRIDEIYHLISTQDWTTAQTTGSHHAASLDSEGFIHCSTREHVLWAANKHYSGVKGLQLLAIDPQKITATWKFDPVPGIGMFPHIYGELNLDAVVRSASLVADEPGNFIFPFK
jgi:glyoxylase I family protein